MLPIIVFMAMLASPADAAPPVKCPPGTGFGGSPVVPTAVAATGIFSAVSRAIGQGQSPDDYVIVAADSDGGWMVFEAPKDRNVRGGGGLGMRIDKCTGAISEIHYQK